MRCTLMSNLRCENGTLKCMTIYQKHSIERLQRRVVVLPLSFDWIDAVEVEVLSGHG